LSLLFFLFFRHQDKTVCNHVAAIFRIVGNPDIGTNIASGFGVSRQICYRVPSISGRSHAMRKKPVKVTGWKEPVGAYSPAIIAGGMVYASGQGPLDPDTHAIVGTTIEEQTTVVLQNLQKILKSAGADLNDCVKVTVHLLNIQDFDRFNAVYKTFFKAPYPARTTVESGLWSNILVEIDAIALLNRHMD
jgi:2-iminobutanoate/2-iminopropanoate deaminase